MKTTTGSNKHRDNYSLLPAINLIINRADYGYGGHNGNIQFHFSFLQFHCWISLNK